MSKEEGKCEEREGEKAGVKERGDEHLDAVGALLQRMIETTKINLIEEMIHQLLSFPSPAPSTLFHHVAIRRYIGEGIVHPVQTVRYLALRSFFLNFLISFYRIFSQKLRLMSFKKQQSGRDVERDFE